MKAAKTKFTYRAKIIKVYDGDTVTAVIDLGFGISKVERLRLARINAPEVRGASRVEGKASRDWLRGEILDQEVIVKTLKDKKGKFGRYIAEVYLGDRNINDAIVETGHAVHKVY